MLVLSTCAAAGVHGSGFASGGGALYSHKFYALMALNTSGTSSVKWAKMVCQKKRSKQSRLCLIWNVVEIEGKSVLALLALSEII